MTLIFSKSENNDGLKGLSYACTTLGVSTFEWDKDAVSILDLVQRTKASVVFIDEEENSPLLSEVHKFCKLVIVTQNQGNKKLKPDLVYSTGQCADLAKFKKNKKNLKSHYSSDILYLSNFPMNKRPYILNNLNRLEQVNCKIRICGNVKMMSPYYAGLINLEDVNNLIGSTKIAIDFDGEMILNYAANEVFCISNMKNPICPSWINIKQLNNFTETLGKYLEKPKDRKQIAKKAKKFIFDNGMTYHHKAADIFTKIGLKDLESKCRNYIKQRK